MAGIDKYTKLLLQFDGVDGSTDFLDSGIHSHKFTPGGNAQIDTAQSKFGGSSLLLDGTGDKITASTHSDFTLRNTTGDSFSIDFWYRANDETDNAIMGQFDNSSDWWAIRIAAGWMFFYAINNGVQGLWTQCSFTFNADQWYHIEITEDATLGGFIFVDGVSQTLTTENNLTCKAFSNSLDIGYYQDTGIYMDGWLDEIRFTVGNSRHTANFTPETEPYAANPIQGIDDDVTLLVHMEGLDATTDFTDSSNSGHTVTATGNAQIDTAAGMFGEPSAVFDGTANTRLTIPDHEDLEFNSGDFTIDFWFRINDFQTGDKLLAGKWIIGGYAPFIFSQNGSNIIFFASSDNANWDIALTRTVATGLVLNQWHHFALTRSGSDYRFFLDGVLTDSLVNGSGSANIANDVLIGGGSSGWYLKGHVAEFRISKGIARWVSAFTPPMAPYSITDIYGVDGFNKLLLHYDGTGATFVDDSDTGHTITPVGGATQDSGASKFGGKSLLLDGSGDWLTVADHDDWNFGTDDFTVDCWFKGSTQGGARGLVMGVLNSSSWSGISWLISLEGTGAETGQILVQMSNNGSATGAVSHYSGSAYDDDTWHHLAFVRYGNVFTLYVDGLATVSVLTDITCLDLAEPLKIGYGATTAYLEYTGDVDETRLSKGIARWAGAFTPPTQAYSEEPVGPPPPDLSKEHAAFLTKAAVSRKRYERQQVNPGFSVTPGMETPVPIKMDKWQNLSQPPARRKKVNPANTTQYIFVDFTVPVLPTIFMDRWNNPHYPRKPKPPRVLPAAFASSDIAAINPVNGNYFDSGVIRFDITLEHADSQTYKDIGVVGLTITAVHTEDFQLEDTGVFGFLVKYPDVGVEVFNSGVPGFVAANVIIDGVNQSNLLQGTVSVSREDNAAARFSISLEHDPTLPIPKKPAEFINKIITINFAAADMDGVVSDYVPIFIGIIKQVSFNPDKDTMKIAGYDYSGIHQTRGEYISGNITDVLTGSVGAGSAGTINTAHSPIWGVLWNGNNAVKDGTDFFVDTLNGQIIIPISSRILQFPGSFTYNYANNFVTMKDIIQAVVTEKSWILTEDGVTITDYTSEAAHPVLSLSDESVIDTCRKFLELSGAKVEGNLFPELRVYSEVENWTSPANTLVFDETIIFENSLTYSVDFDNILNEQTVRSVQRVSAEIEIGALETIATFEADSPSTNPFTVQQGVTWVWKLDLATPTVLAEHRIAKSGLNSISLSASGRFHLALWPNQFVESISGGSFNWFVDGDDFVIQLSHNVVVVRVLNLALYAYPAFEYSLVVNGSRINYGGGSPEDVRVVTAQRPVGGITETLKGDVYENPYIETDTHCVNICNAVLLEHGNPYNVQFDIPLYQGKTAQIGMRVDIKRGGSVKFSGIIKKLDYSMNLENGENRITVIAKGIGKGI